MGTKLHRVVLYVLDLNNPNTETSIRQELSNMRYLEGVKVTEVKTTDIGEWSDDHILNKTASGTKEYERYFPEISAPTPTALQTAYETERTLRLKAEAEAEKAQREKKQLQNQLQHYQEIAELVKKIKS